jgi:hypothetical protein
MTSLKKMYNGLFDQIENKPEGLFSIGNKDPCFIKKSNIL